MSWRKTYFHAAQTLRVFDTGEQKSSCAGNSQFTIFFFFLSKVLHQAGEICDVLDFRKRRKRAEWLVNNVSCSSMNRKMARRCVVIFVAIHEIKINCIAMYYIKYTAHYDCFNISQMQGLHKGLS